MDALERHGAPPEADEVPTWDPCRTLFEHVEAYKDVQLSLATGRGGAILREAVDAVLTRTLRSLIVVDPSQSLPRDLITQHIISTFHTIMTWWFAARPEMRAADADALFRQMLLRPIPPAACSAFMSPQG